MHQVIFIILKLSQTIHTYSTITIRWTMLQKNSFTRVLHCHIQANTCITTTTTTFLMVKKGRRVFTSQKTFTTPFQILMTVMTLLIIYNSSSAKKKQMIVPAILALCSTQGSTCRSTTRKAVGRTTGSQACATTSFSIFFILTVWVQMI